MARIEFIQKARASKYPRRCDYHACEHADRTIQVGESYKKFSANRFSPTMVRHTDHPDWRQSEMETSKLATVYAGQESAGDNLDALDADAYIGLDDKENDARYQAEAVDSDIRSALEDASSAAEECAAEYQEGIDNMPEGLQEGDVAMQSQERIDALEEYQSAIEDWSVDAEWDAEEVDNDTESLDDRDDRFREWVQAQVDSARDVLDSLEV